MKSPMSKPWLHLHRKHLDDTYIRSVWQDWWQVGSCSDYSQGNTCNLPQVLSIIWWDANNWKCDAHTRLQNYWSYHWLRSPNSGSYIQGMPSAIGASYSRGVSFSTCIPFGRRISCSRCPSPMPPALIPCAQVVTCPLSMTLACTGECRTMDVLVGITAAILCNNIRECNSVV